MERETGLEPTTPAPFTNKAVLSVLAVPTFIFPAAVFKVKREYQESLIGSN